MKSIVLMLEIVEQYWIVLEKVLNSVKIINPMMNVNVEEFELQDILFKIQELMENYL